MTGDGRDDPSWGDRPLVVGVDGSPDGVRALAWALDLAGQVGAAVDVVHVRGRRAASSGSVAEGQLEHVLSTRTARRDVRASAREADGHPVTRLVEAGSGASAVVVGARGHGRLFGALSGSVSQHVAQLAPCPVVVVREPADPGARTVVLGVDEEEPGVLSTGSRHAAEFAFRIAASTGAPVRVLRAWHDADLDRSGIVLTLRAELTAEDRAAALRDIDRSLERLRHSHPGVEVTRDVTPTHPQRLLADASEHAALVVVGSRGRGPVSGVLLGSVSQAVLQHAGCPVAIVR